jgi:hypothetical protein
MRSPTICVFPFRLPSRLLMWDAWIRKSPANRLLNIWRICPTGICLRILPSLSIEEAQERGSMHLYSSWAYLYPSSYEDLRIWRYQCHKNRQQIKSQGDALLTFYVAMWPCMSSSCLQSFLNKSYKNCSLTGYSCSVKTFLNLDHHTGLRPFLYASIRYLLLKPISFHVALDKKFEEDSMTHMTEITIWVEGIGEALTLLLQMRYPRKQGASLIDH